MSLGEQKIEGRRGEYLIEDVQHVGYDRVNGFRAAGYITGLGGERQRVLFISGRLWQLEKAYTSIRQALFGACVGAV